MAGTGGFLNPEETVKQLNIIKGMKVADFGCGAGFFAIPLAKAIGEDGKLYALDVLETALESVRSRAKIQGLFNIETKRCNLENPNGSGLDNNSIDMAVLVNILFQSDDKPDIIKEAYRVLKNKGTAIVIDWEANQPMGPPKNLVVSPEAIKEMVGKQGLKFKNNIQVDRFHWGMLFEKI